VLNLSGEKIAFVLLVALLVLGPDKLPEFVRSLGRLYGELRRMSAGFQSELRDALDEPMQSLRDTASAATAGFGLNDTDDGDRAGAGADGRSALDGAVAAVDNKITTDDAPASSDGAVSVGAASESPGAAGGAVGRAGSSAEQR
jgi:Sec-independent protein translocase protein TatA